MRKRGISLATRRGGKSFAMRRGQARMVRRIPKRKYVRPFTEKEIALLPNYFLYREVLYKDIVGISVCPYCKAEYIVKNQYGKYGKPEFDFFSHHKSGISGNVCKGSQKKVLEVAPSV